MSTSLPSPMNRVTTMMTHLGMSTTPPPSQSRGTTPEPPSHSIEAKTVSGEQSMNPLSNSSLSCNPSNATSNTTSDSTMNHGLRTAETNNCVSSMISANKCTAEATIQDCVEVATRTKALKKNVDIRIRRLERTDFTKGFPAILSQLTDLGDVNEAKFQATFDRIMNLPNLYHVMVGEDVGTGRIACAATLIIEDKFIHGCGRVGHVEDVVVDSNYRGLNLGAR